MSPDDIAHRYFASVRERDIERFIALFAEDATFVLPDGRELSGAPAIREMELGVFASGAPTPIPGLMIVGVDAVAVEVKVRLPNDAVYCAASIFQLDGDGRIRRLSVYRQGR